MNSKIERPNIFKVSTKELSQDAFIVWLIQWANPLCHKLDPIMHQCGTDFLKLLMNNNMILEKKVKLVEAGRQWKQIDVWVKIHFEDNTTTFMIIEDKTFSNEHSDQLNRYKKQAEQYCDENSYHLICTYFKIGSESLRELNTIRAKGFNVVGRKEIKDCLTKYTDTQHSLLKDFIEYIDYLEAKHCLFETLPLNEWKGEIWIGFYQFVEARLKVNTWHKVNNPAGGFWNLCLTWRYWGRIPVYMQIEERKLCFKIAPGNIETLIDLSPQGMNTLQNTALEKLLTFSGLNCVSYVKRPYPFVHRGNYRTFAIIEFENWCGLPNENLNKEKVLAQLSSIINFYHSFMDQLENVDFASIGVNIKDV